MQTNATTRAILEELAASLVERRAALDDLSHQLDGLRDRNLAGEVGLEPEIDEIIALLDEVERTSQAQLDRAVAKLRPRVELRLVRTEHPTA